MEMELDSGHYQVFVDVVQALVAAGLGIGLWILKKSQVNAERINDLESDLDKRLEGQGRQVARIEETLKHYPNRGRPRQAPQPDRPGGQRNERADRRIPRRASLARHDPGISAAPKGAVMTDFEQFSIEQARLAILEILSTDSAYRHNEGVLYSALHQLGHSASSDQVRSELAWLEEQGLIRVETVGDVSVASLLERGLDCARGLTRVPGVARPRPGR